MQFRCVSAYDPDDIFTEGSYENIDRLWLRWFTALGELILTSDEEAAAAQERAMSAEQEAAEARHTAERLAAKLRELNIGLEELE